MPREPIQLREFEHLHDLDLTEAEARALSGLREIDVSPSPATEGWALTAKQYVGVLRAGKVEIRIQPKVSTGNLLFLLAYARDQTGWRNLVASMDSSRDLVSAIAMGFVHHAELALQRGVLQGYVRREDALHTVRGRIRSADQLTRHFGLPLPLEVTFDEFTPDIAENRILRTALQRVSAIPHVPSPTARAARHLAGRLEGVSSFDARAEIPTISFNRLNERYRSAVILGRLILSAQSLSFRHGPISATGFVFDMNKVFEDFVTAALTSAFRSMRVRLEPQHTVHLDRVGSIPMRPDITWYVDRSTAGVADIKYKSLATADLPNADVYQALAYAIGHRLRTAHLIYAAGNEAPATHEMRNLETAIMVHALDLSRGTTELLIDIQQLASRLLGSPRAPSAEETHWQRRLSPT
jgi:5-methylcytosine-specific restriction enzyme subunit McrC